MVESEIKQRTTAKSKPTSKKDSSQTTKENDSVETEKKPAAGALKFGPLGIKKEDQAWSRAVLMTGVLVIVIVMKWRKSNEITWVSSQEVVTKPKVQPLICSTSFRDEINTFPSKE